MSELQLQDKIALSKIPSFSMEAPEDAGDVQVIKPKQKSVFEDFKSPVLDINGNTLENEIKDKSKKAAEENKGPEVKEVITPDSPKAAPILDKAIGSLTFDNPPAEGDEGDEKQPSTKISAKSDLVDLLLDKIEKENFQVYDDFDEEKQTLREYLEGLPKKDLNSLIDDNYKSRENQIKETYKQEVFESFPGHLKHVAQVLAGEEVDPREIYGALARVEQTTALDPAKEADQLAIVHNWLQTSKFGTAQEIEAQVEEWKEEGKIATKAAQFKPKLDKAQEEQLKAYAIQAEEIKKEREQQAKWYHQNVVKTLQDADLGNGIKLNRKNQEALYNAMMIDLKPSQLNGELQDLLNQKIEKAKYIEPDFKFLTRLTLFASDPDAYDEMMKQLGKNEATGTITRELKTAQGSGSRGVDLKAAQPTATKRTVTEDPKERKIIKQRSPLEKTW